ncbi:MAG: cation:proton antiporter [Bacteroidales bacterium]
MNPTSYEILIFICIVIVISYIFNIISDKTKIPSVILLIITGIASHQIAVYYQVEIPIFKNLLEILGIVGLILIVLEGALDLEITRSKRPIILKSLTVSFIALIITSLGLSAILHFLNGIDIKLALIYAVPMAIISSAIAIPTANNMDKQKKEFIIYESTFSDILGIMVFNYVISEKLSGWNSLGVLFWNFILIIVISIVNTALLLILFKFLKEHLKIFLILALLVLTYALSKNIHLPSLLLIFVFGLVLNNMGTFISKNFTKIIEPEKLNSTTLELKKMTIELAFIIRTFFFLLFGFSIDISLIFSLEVVTTGVLILAVIMVFRYLTLKYVTRTNIFPELFIAPRGLITILLFYSIPGQFLTGKFNEGVLSFVILSSNIIMTIGIIFSKQKFGVENELDTAK